MMSQSGEILVRRQKFVRELRRKEVQAYMQRIRERLIKEQDPNQIHYEDSFLQGMRDRLEDENYSHRSIEDFLRSLGRYTSESLCNPHLMRLVDRALMHVLVFGENEKEGREAHRLGKELLTRVLQCEGGKEGRWPLQYCFNEVFGMLQNQDFQMLDLWKIVALFRSEVFFTSSFLKFMSFLEHYRVDIIGIVSPLFEVLKNFTATIEGSERIVLSQNDLCNVIHKVEICMKNYIISDTDLVMLLDIMQNILKLHSFSVMVTLVSQILPELLKYLDELVEEISANTVLAILQFLGVCLSGDEGTTERLISKHNLLVPLLCQFMPGYPHLLLKGITPKPKSLNSPIILAIIFCFSNIVAYDRSLSLMIYYNIVPWMVRCSNDSSPFLKEQLSYFFYNMVAVSDDQRIEILLEGDILNAIYNLVSQQYSHTTMIHALKALKIICKQTRNFPDNLAWHFNLSNITIHSHRLGLFSALEQLMISQDEELSILAQACLNAMGDVQVEHC